MAYLNHITIQIWFFHNNDHDGLKKKRKMERPISVVDVFTEATALVCLDGSYATDNEYNASSFFPYNKFSFFGQWRPIRSTMKSKIYLNY